MRFIFQHLFLTYDIVIAATTVQFVETTAQCREIMSSPRSCCFEVERIGGSSTVVEVGVTTQNGTAQGA